MKSLILCLFASALMLCQCSSSSSSSATGTGNTGTTAVTGKANAEKLIPAATGALLGTDAQAAFHESEEMPVHSVSMPAFRMSEYEITVYGFTSVFNRALARIQGSELLLDSVHFVRGDTLVDSIVNMGYRIKSLRLRSDTLFFRDSVICRLDSMYITPSLQYETSDTLDTLTHKERKVNTFAGITLTPVRSMVDKPMVNVTWYGAALYCALLSMDSGLVSCYDTLSWSVDTSKSGFRLATEAEWEYAARAGRSQDSSFYPTGPWLSPTLANFKTFALANVGGNSTLPFPANPWGLYDMAGNAWEWCTDFYSGAFYAGLAANVVNPVNTVYNAAGRVIRGGCYLDNESELYSAHRVSAAPNTISERIGFRVVRKAP